MSASVVNFNAESDSLDIRSWEACLPQLKNAKIIAATTTGMSKLGFIVAKTNPQLVVLEEAAEIAEPHALATLLPTCKKVIQIGDHQQLRPKVNEYDSAVKHHMDVSLMERLIRSGHIEYATLCTQRRMRPEIAQYTTRLYEERLKEMGGVHTHEVARLRPPLASIGSTVVFLNHHLPEQNEDMFQSKHNPGEARFIVQLAEYLSRQTETDQLDVSCITILTPYTGQVRHLRKLLRDVNLEVRVASIDDFQGEENDVIILSLVRSEAVGFLKTDNRICVALSRARRGMIVVGNLDLFENAKLEKDTPTYWATVIDIARRNNHLLDAITLSCPRHGTLTTVRVDESIRTASPLGGCSQRCGMRRECGHACERNCHLGPCNDAPCNKRCSKTCEQGHPCTLPCNAPCQCQQLVEKTFGCEHAHKAVVPCYVDSAPENCKKLLTRATGYCDHPVQAACGLATKDLPKCRITCGMDLRGCKHKCASFCGNCKGSRFHPPCSERCNRSLLCGHVCPESCSLICRPCEAVCLSECPHTKCPKSCGDACTPCAEPCRANIGCTHGETLCQKQCGEPCDVSSCGLRCEKKNACGHQCRGICGETCPTVCFECKAFDVDEHDPIFMMADENSLFLRLTPCGHEIAMDSMDGWVRSRVRDNLPYLECPQCKCRITHSHRYQSTLFDGLSARLFLNAQKWKIKKLEEDAKLKQLAIKERTELVNAFNDIEETDDYNSPFYSAIDSFLSATRSFIAGSKAEEGTPIALSNKRHIKDLPTFCQRVAKTAIQLRIIIISLRGQTRNIPVCAELNDLAGIPSADCTEEIRRAVQLQYLRHEGVVGADGQLPPQGDELEAFINTKLEEVHRNRPLTPKEHEYIRTALAVGNDILAGAWYACECGYIYGVGNCGAARQVGTCPECRRQLDGTRPDR